jgi:hypothetical protein
MSVGAFGDGGRVEKVGDGSLKSTSPEPTLAECSSVVTVSIQSGVGTAEGVIGSNGWLAAATSEIMASEYNPGCFWFVTVGLVLADFVVDRTYLLPTISNAPSLTRNALSTLGLM